MRVAAFARDWRDEYRREQQISGRGTFVPLSFAPGEAFQFEWSEDWAIIAGVRTKLQVAHFKISHSRAFIVRAYLSSEEHTSELQSIMRISYDVFCLTKTKTKKKLYY